MLEATAVNHDAEFIAVGIRERLVHVVQDRRAFVTGSVDGINSVGSEKLEQRLAIALLFREDLLCLLRAHKDSVAGQRFTHLLLGDVQPLPPNGEDATEGYTRLACSQQDLKRCVVKTHMAEAEISSVPLVETESESARSEAEPGLKTIRDKSRY